VAPYGRHLTAEAEGTFVEIMAGFEAGGARQAFEDG